MHIYWSTFEKLKLVVNGASVWTSTFACYTHSRTGIEALSAAMTLVDWSPERSVQPSLRSLTDLTVLDPGPESAWA